LKKEEIALQLTLARLDSLFATSKEVIEAHSQAKEINSYYNEQIAVETYKLFNTIYNNLDLKDCQK